MLGEALDRDPFLLFELRGRTKTQVFEALRSARAQKLDEGKTRAGPKRSGAKSEHSQGIVLATLDAAGYERASASLPSLRLTFESPPLAGNLLRQLGNPPGWSITHSPAELFAAVICEAAKRARRIAMAEVQQAPDPDSA